MYRKAKQISPFWLMVNDIVYSYHISHKEADIVASLIWPASPIQIAYRTEAQRRKHKFRMTGAFPMSPAGLLTEDIHAEITRLL